MSTGHPSRWSRPASREDFPQVEEISVAAVRMVRGVDSVISALSCD
jgi:hypothetical protein